MIAIQQQNIELSDEQQTSTISVPQCNSKPRFIAQLNNIHKRRKTLALKGPHNKTKTFDEQDYLWQSKADFRIRGKRNSDGLLYGHVQIIRDDGFYFKGQYKDGIRMNGFIKFANGFSYHGQFFNDQFRGFGILTFPNGKLVTGQWYDGYVEENARIDYPTGQIYYGSLKKLKKHGQGHLFFTDNSKYIGTFQEGKIHGKGQYYKNDLLVAKGTWNDGVLNNSPSGKFFKKASQVSIKLECSLTDSDITY